MMEEQLLTQRQHRELICMAEDSSFISSVLLGMLICLLNCRCSQILGIQICWILEIHTVATVTSQLLMMVGEELGCH